MLSYDIDIGRNLKQKLLKEDMFGKRETQTIWKTEQLLWV